jgi:hypothetical protein
MTNFPIARRRANGPPSPLPSSAVRASEKEIS